MLHHSWFIKEQTFTHWWHLLFTSTNGLYNIASCYIGLTIKNYWCENILWSVWNCHRQSEFFLVLSFWSQFALCYGEKPMAHKAARVRHERKKKRWSKRKYREAGRRQIASCRVRMCQICHVGKKLIHLVFQATLNVFNFQRWTISGSRKGNSTLLIIKFMIYKLKWSRVATLIFKISLNLIIPFRPRCHFLTVVKWRHRRPFPYYNTQSRRIWKFVL